VGRIAPRVCLSQPAAAGPQCDEATQIFYRVSANPCGGNLGASCGQATIVPVLKSYRENMERVCANERARDQRKQDELAREREKNARVAGENEMKRKRQAERDAAYRRCLQAAAGLSETQVAQCQAYRR
jgi:hypothetical protein